MYAEIVISNLRVYGRHGVIEAEKTLGQKFEIDMVCGIRRPAAAADTMENTLCYAKVCDEVVKVSDEQSYNLIETLAESIVSRMFDMSDLIEDVKITIRKPHAPIRHNLEHVAVVLTRNRSQHS